MNQIKIAQLSDIERVIPILRELRPERSEEEIRMLFPLMLEQGYCLAYIGEVTAHSMIGYRIVITFFNGKTLVVDDLATLPQFRTEGLATRLFSWIKQQAREKDCEHICLNSGFHRQEAHRFYFNHGLHIRSLHFGCRVDQPIV